MARSLKKGIFVSVKLVKKINALNNTKKKQVIKTGTKFLPL